MPTELLEADAPVDSDVAVAPLSMPTLGEELADRYSVRELATRGGMGAIYRGVDLQTNQPVAIKWIGSTSRNARRRFLREGKILGALAHPRVVAYLAQGATEAGMLFLVMEWLEGEDLAVRLARGPLPQQEALEVTRGACEGLAAAHARGVVHRDIKPANLFLEGGAASGVKVLDFGVALFDGTVSSLSTEASLVGTVGYMAPEQVMCEKDVDARADVFAMGCVLYECLTGVAPFASAHAVGVLAKVLREDPRPPSELQPALDPRLDELIARLLAKKRADRPPDISAVVAELDALGTLMTDGAGRRARHASVPPRSEQRIVSVILARPSSSEHMRPAENTREEILERLSSKFEVEVAALQGGALLVVLTGRGRANDRAAQAALCALDLMHSRPDLSLAIATGLADTSVEVPVGAAIDRAAELLERGSPGTPGVRIDDVTTRLIGVRFDVQREGGTELLVGARAHLDTSRQLMGRPTPHVGRDREMGMLDSILEECVAEGVSRTVLVTGPPGIGKSRLSREWLVRNQRAEAARILFCRADPGAAGSALLLVQQLLRTAVGLREADAPDVQLARLRQYVASQADLDVEHAEFLAELVGLESTEEPSPILRAARKSPEIMQDRIRRSLHAWLDSETAKQPVIVVLEDLHWGDTPSVSFLTEALVEKADRPLMVLALARPDADRQFPKLGECAALRIRLLGLNARAAHQLVSAALEHTPDEEVVTRLIRTAEGNPFYLEELIRRVATGGTELPDTVLAMAQSRIEELDYDARHALRAASVFGERAWDLGVQELIGADADAKRLIAGLVRDELLVELPDSRHAGTREYRFRHALLRDAAYAMMLESDRRLSHGVAGNWLERNHEKDGRVLADHFEAAGLRERAVPWLIRAAKASVDAGDIGRTIQLASRGVAMGATGTERGRLLLARAYAEAQRGDPNLDVAREALELLPVGSAPWWLGLATLIFGSGIQGKPEVAEPYIAIAHDAPLTNERDIPFGQGLVTLVGGLVLLGKSDFAELITERVARSAAYTTEPDPIFDGFLKSARCALASVAPIRSKWRLEQALVDGRAAVESLRALGAVHGESVALYYLASAAIHLGLYEEALQSARLSVELTERAVYSINDGWPRLFWARALLRLGRPDEALSAVSALGSSPNLIVRHMLPVVVAEARLRLGDFHAAEAAAAPACAGVSPRLRRLAACISARAQLGLGRPEEALATANHGLGKQSTPGLESDLDLLTLRAEALHAVGRRDEAVEAIGVACDFVMRIARDIDDPSLKTSYLENVDVCARALALRSSWAGASA